MSFIFLLFYFMNNTCRFLNLNPSECLQSHVAFLVRVEEKT